MPPKSTGHLSEILNCSLFPANNLSEHKIRLLLSEVAGVSVPELLLNKDLVLTSEQILLFQEYLKRLAAGEPVQYVTGKAYFYGLVLQVNESVLIPRPETEGLVDWIAGSEKDGTCILDIGTGSGAIALALKKLNPNSVVTATDVSAQAICLARRNAEALNLKVKFCVADLFCRGSKQYDVIVSNPPYISTAEYAFLDEEIRLYEPKLALIASASGLEFYSRILHKANQHLRTKGKIYMEIGETQAKSVKQIAVNCGFNSVEVKSDLTGKDRYLRISR